MRTLDPCTEAAGQSLTVAASEQRSPTKLARSGPMQKDCAVMSSVHAHVCPPSLVTCLMVNVLACHRYVHLCVTLGKKARLHLMFSVAKAETNARPSLLDVCLKRS